MSILRYRGGSRRWRGEENIIMKMNAGRVLVFLIFWFSPKNWYTGTTTFEIDVSGKWQVAEGGGGDG